MIFNSIAIASDHRGCQLRSQLVEHFEACGYDFTDFGTTSDTPSVDYPDYAKNVAEYVRDNVNSCGVLVCYSGVGMSIAANRFSGVRAVLCYSDEIARLSREHNDANVICFGAGFISTETAMKSLEVFFNIPFDPRHLNRVQKIDAIHSELASNLD